MSDTLEAFAVTTESRRPTLRFPMASEIDFALRLVSIEGSVSKLRRDTEERLETIQRDVLYNAQLIVAVQTAMHERFDALGVKMDELLSLARKATANGLSHG